MSIRAKYALCGVLLLAAVGVCVVNLPKGVRVRREARPQPPVVPALTRVQTSGPAILRIDVRELKATTVTAHLEYAITSKENVLWCASFQVAWNELCVLLGGPVQPAKAGSMADILNRRAVTREDLDEASYVAMAGYPTRGPDDILDRITAAVKEKFKNAVTPRLLPSRRAVGRRDWVAYACLYKELPFEWSFERMDYPLDFTGHEVENFGIHQLREGQENEVKAASQVGVHDYRNRDDFIVELTTVSKSDRLILAKIAPGPTLAETVRAVQGRLAQQAAVSLREMSDLFIPVLDFDLFRRYGELRSIGYAAQDIRFRLDERGAVLESEATIARMEGLRLVFDKPFLLMIQRKDASRPYFALWVANAELLVPFRPRDQAGM